MWLASLSGVIEYAVQTGRARIVSFEWLLPLTELGATKSGIDGRVFDVIAIIMTLVSVVPGLAITISGF